jgi:hypothetical protein
MGQFAEAKEEMCPEACCGKPVTECVCGPDCKHCDCHSKNKAMKETKGKDHDNDGDVDSDDYMAAKDKAIKKAMGKDDKELDEQKIPVSEFILSLFDREQGTFPKGETAVLTAIEKDYGEQYIEPAKQFIERIQSTYEQYVNPVPEPMIDEEPEGTVMEPTIEQDEEMDESGLQYHTGVKKHGKEYMVKAAQAGREGASQEELGRLKDKYSKAEKNKDTKEAQDIMRLAGL